MKRLNLYNFYPKHLNLYGDRGNLMILIQRAKWRGIELCMQEVNGYDAARLSDADILVWGGGGDRDQFLVGSDLARFKADLQALIQDGVAGLAICGGYQLLGQYYETMEEVRIPGVGLFDYFTKGKKNRLVGDVLVESEEFGSILGFENHAGRTYHLGKSLGTVLKGHGNNGEDRQEGFRFNHFIGTYLHGPLLPKNPFLADQLLLWALERKYGDASLSPLEDSLSERARRQAIQVLQKRSN